MRVSEKPELPLLNNRLASVSLFHTDTGVQKVSRDVFRAKAAPCIAYDWKDTFSRYSLKALKWLFCLFTIPASILIKKIAREHGIAGREAKVVNAKAMGRLHDLGGCPFQFEAQDGVRLEGMRFLNPKALPSAKTILVCSGSHQSSENYNVPIVRALLAMGHHVMTFNYRGFGNSEGEATESGLYKDGEAAYQNLCSQGLVDDDIVFYGYSLGGAIAADLGARHHVDVVLDRTFSSGTDRAEEAAPSPSLKWLARFVAFTGCHFDNVSKLKYLKRRVFIFQEHENNRHLNFLARMQKIVPGGRCTVADEPVGHFHNEYTLWFRQDSDSVHKDRLDRFLKR